MNTGWQYRLGSVGGVGLLAALSVLLANHPLLQTLFTTYVPVFWRLNPIVLSGPKLALSAALTAGVVTACLLPLYKPRPRRILDIVALAHKRVLVSGAFLATLGFFDYTYRLPRATLVLTTAVLFVTVPAWFVLLRQTPTGATDRTIVISDDKATMETIFEAIEEPIVGYVAPRSWGSIDLSDDDGVWAIPDGGAIERATRSQFDALPYLGGFSTLDEVLVEHGIDSAIVAFEQPDRQEFFGVLDACYEHGLTVRTHRQHGDSVLTGGDSVEELVEVELEPWDALDHVQKRAFDVAFAATVLAGLSPILFVIAVLIKLDDGGPILYSQQRTATFGDTYTLYKFRSMTVNAEAESGAKISDEDDGGIDPRVTRIGRVLRKTHLDEIPQLWSVLVGKMSVVGPRPERPELDGEMERDADAWRRRWFVKPGLTGLAQINDVTGKQPERKLRYDIEYIRRQSFGFDLQIVVRQVWKVVCDVVALLR